MQIISGGAIIEGPLTWGFGTPGQAGAFGTNFINLKRWGNAPNFGFRRYNGTIEAPTAVNLNDVIGFWGAGGFPGGGPLDFSLESGLFVVANENQTVTARGTRAQLNAVLNGATLGRACIEARPSAVAADTDVMIFDVSAAILQRVTIGAANSAGAGFRQLRVPN